MENGDYKYFDLIISDPYNFPILEQNIQISLKTLRNSLRTLTKLLEYYQITSHQIETIKLFETKDCWKHLSFTKLRSEMIILFEKIPKIDVIPPIPKLVTRKIGQYIKLKDDNDDKQFINSPGTISPFTPLTHMKISKSSMENDYNFD
jgi:hypothetical protein